MFSLQFKSEEKLGFAQNLLRILKNQIIGEEKVVLIRAGRVVCLRAHVEVGFLTVDTWIRSHAGPGQPLPFLLVVGVVEDGV